MINPEVYEQETGDLRPTPPKRMWANRMENKYTKNGLIFIKESNSWTNRFLKWYHERIANETAKR